MANPASHEFLQVIDTNGPQVGATAEYYITGTSTPAAVYADADLSTTLGNILSGANASDSKGRFPIHFLDPSVSYKRIIKTSTGATWRTDDPVQTATVSASTLTVVANIATLQASTFGATPPALILLVSNTALGDGGGIFRFDSTDTLSADNGATIIVDASGNRWKRQSYQELFDVALADNGWRLPSADTPTLYVNGAAALALPLARAQAVNALGLGPGAVLNGSLAASVAGNALTIALKGADGNDPSATNPVIVVFRSATLTDGKPVALNITAALSVVVSSGSTLGTSNGVAATLRIVIFNDAGTARLGVINGAEPDTASLYSSTAEGGAGAADSASVIYTGTAVTSKALASLGFVEITEATAGAWATAPTKIHANASSDRRNADQAAMAAMTAGRAATADLIRYSPSGCKIFVNFNGTGTIASRDAFNVSSLTDNGTGDYSVTFGAALSDGNYVPVFSTGTFGSTVANRCVSSSTVSTSVARTQISVGNTSALTDQDQVGLLVFHN